VYFLLAAALPLVFGCGGPDAQFTVVVIPKGLTHEHWQSVRRGAERCAADLQAEEGLSVRIIFDGPLRERDAMEQIRIVDRRVATGASGIVLAPQHSRTMTACVKRAAEAGLPVVVIDSGLAEKGSYVKYVATDNYNGGCLAAKHLIARLKERNERDKLGRWPPKLILFRYAVGSQATEDREQGFLDTVKDICPDAVWLSTDQFAGATRDSAMRAAGPLVLRFKDEADGIFAPNESSATGMAEVLKSQGHNKKIMVMGFDASKPLLDMIREGDIVGSILQDPYRMGYVSTWYCVQALRGRDVNSHGRDMSESTGEYLVTRENLDTEFVRGLYDPATQAKRDTWAFRYGPKEAVKERGP
jgi:ribose transport system substrate-binding protein